MTGLLVKDLLNLKRLVKQYILILGVMCVWAVMMKNPSFIAMYMVLCTAMLVPSTFSYDEAAQFEKYALTMPLTRKTLVREKYLLLICMIGGGTVGGILLSALINRLVGESNLELSVTGVIMGTIFLMAYSIVIPLIFKLGVEKGRMVLVVIYLGIFGIVFGGIWLFKRTGGIGISEDQMLMLLSGGGILLALAAFAVSYMVSLKIIKRKEY